MATNYTDPFDAANDPEVKSGSGNTDYFGQIKLESWFCVLAKGYGKVPFDPNQHKPEQRVTAIEMQIIPLAEMNIAWDVSRNCIAESREWAGVVLPSIKNLGLSPREINNRWGHICKKETGKTYTSKRDGQQYPETTFEFIEVFADEEACRAAYTAFAAGAGTVPAQPAAAAPSPAPVSTAQQAPVNGNGSSKEKETALKFLRVIVENAAKGQTDLNLIQATAAANIANMPMVSKYFTATSAETLNLIAEAMSK